MSNSNITRNGRRRGYRPDAGLTTHSHGREKMALTSVRQRTGAGNSIFDTDLWVADP